MTAGRPLSHEEIQQLGYRVTPEGWALERPEARPPGRRGLCRMCSKFGGMFDGWCAGCVWFGPGDPHGVKRKPEDPPAKQTRTRTPAPVPSGTPGCVRQDSPLDAFTQALVQLVESP